MSGRIQSIDALRGLAIIGMVFSGAIGYGSGLPAWMFHCQVPPPDYVFHPEIRGISWVDLVFPFFIFSMGAAFPLALRKKKEQGRLLVPGIIKRWITLVLFGLAIGNSWAIRGTDLPDWSKLLMSLAAWGGFFATLVRTDRKWINPAGLLFTAGLFALAHFVFGASLSLHRTDIIIMILSAVALGGSLVWILTKDNLPLRGAIWLLVFFLKLFEGRIAIFGKLAVPEPFSSLFAWDWLQYLLIAIPGSMVGDMLAAARKSNRKAVQDGISSSIAQFVAVAALFVQLWGLYTRNVAIDLAASAALAAVYVALTLRDKGTAAAIGRLGFALLLGGVAFDPLDGGIAKDYCNISYLLTTAGMASLACSVFIAAEGRGRRFGFLALTGQNPMLAYTISGFVLSPLLYAVGLFGLVDGLAEGSVAWGLARGVLETSLMCLCTCIFTKKNLFWRS